MSRHRNFRNRQYSYDYDDDYYDDDYYDDEEEDEYYLEQERLRREQDQREKAYSLNLLNDNSAANTKVGKMKGQKSSITTINANQKSAPPPTAPPPGFGKATSPSGVGTIVNESDVISLLNMGVGVSPAQCREALQMFDNSLDRAMDYLLSKEDYVEDNSKQTEQKTSFVQKETKNLTQTKIASSGPISISSAPKKKDINKTTSLSVNKIPHKKLPTPNQKRQLPSTTTELKKVKDNNGSKSSVVTKKVSPILTGRSRLSMVVLGHVDAGKSTLMGQLLLQLGHVEKRVISKFEKQATEIGKSSFALAWVFDTDESERERGVTMDVGTRLAKTKSHDIVILDAPGHQDFVPAMIHGAASADVGLLVISAAAGEFESGFDAPSTSNDHGKVGQTREHIVLSRGLGVSQLLVVVNKLDRTVPAWSQARYDHIKNTVLPFILRSGFNAKRVRFVPVSGLNGDNVNNSESKSQLFNWYKGPSLIDAIDNFKPAQRNVDKPLRFVATDVFGEGKGMTVSGRVVQGTVKVGDIVVVYPIGDRAVVNNIDHGSAFSGRSIGSIPNSSAADRKTAVAGDSVDIVLPDIDISRVSPGAVICPVGKPVPLKRKILAQIVVMDNLSVPIINGTQVSLHIQSVDVPAVISKLVKVTGSKLKTKPRRLLSGNNATVEIKFSERLCVETYTECKSLGRFALRRGGQTIAVGIVEQLL